MKFLKPKTNVGAAGDEAGPERPRRVGDLLRETRQRFGGNLDQIGATLRIRPAYLEAIEEGAYDRLPGPTYAQGFVRTYAEHLGLDGVEMVRRFKLESAGHEERADLSFPMPAPERSRPGGAILVGALVLAACAYGAWYYVSSGDRARPERVAALPTELVPPPPAPAVPLPPEPSASPGATPAPFSAGEQPAPPASSPSAAAPSSASSAPSPTASSSPAAPSTALPAPAPSSSSAPPAPTGPSSAAPPSVAAAPAPGAPVPSGATPQVATAPAIPPSAPSAPAATAPGAIPAIPDAPAGGAAEAPRVYGAVNAPARIVLRATAESWVQVRDAQQAAIFTRTLQPGQTYRVPDQPGLSLNTGNAGGLVLEVDGRALPALGGSGKPRRNIALDPSRLLGGAGSASAATQ